MSGIIEVESIVNSTTIGSSFVAFPSLNGGSSNPQGVTTTLGVSLSNISYSNFIWIYGVNGAATVTATPSITAPTADGQILTIFGLTTSSVTLQDNGALAGSGLYLNGQWVALQYSQLILSSNMNLGAWCEISRR